MTLGQACIYSGLLSALVYVGFRLFRDRSFAATEISPLLTVFLAGCNVPAACYLIYYGLYPQPNALDTYEKFVSMAGLSLLATAGITLFSSISKPRDRSESSRTPHESDDNIPKA